MARRLFDERGLDRGATHVIVDRGAFGVVRDRTVPAGPDRDGPAHAGGELRT